MQASAKDYAKFTGKKYRDGVVSLEPTAEELGHKELVDTIGEKAANAMQQLRTMYAKMNKTEPKPHSDIVSDLVESAAQDYVRGDAQLRKCLCGCIAGQSHRHEVQRCHEEGERQANGNCQEEWPHKL